MKYVPGPMFGQFSGSQGNTTASHNKFGSYTRNRVIPADPATAKQTAIRNLIQAFSADWRDLTEANRLLWASLGDQMIRTDTQGQSYSLTGVQAFTSVNMNRDLIGDTPLVIAPLLAIPIESFSLTLTVDDGAVFNMATDLVQGAADHWVIEASDGVSAGINFRPRSAYKFLGSIEGTITSPEDFSTEYDAVFGSRLVGEKIFLRARQISEEGFSGTVVKANAIVTAAP